SGVRLPVRLRTGKHAGQIRWVPPTLSRVLRVLKNPRYAGVYFYGRTRQKKGLPSGTLPREQWKVFIPDAHPGYIRNYPKTRKIITILVKLVLVSGFSDSFLAWRSSRPPSRRCSRTA